MDKHIKLDGKFLADAEQLIKEGDYVQASEKLWGATAQILKSIALRRGKRLRSHSALSRFITDLSKELNDNSLLTLYNAANGLHQNFYEDWLTPKAVIQGAKDIKRLIKRLSPLL